MKHGNGNYVKKNSFSYIGNWVYDHMEGKGTLNLSSGAYYSGDMVANKPHGKGEEVFPDMSRYIGDFFEG